MDIREYLKEHKLITDGSIGTYYAEKYSTWDMPEKANISDSNRIVDIHLSYINSGAKLIRTNTFAANTVQLKTGFYEVSENIKCAVDNAFKAVKLSGRDVFVAGSIGPISEYGHFKNDTEEEYYQIATTFINRGVTVLIFETFPDMDQISGVIKKIRNEYRDVFIMVQFCINQFGYSSSGRSITRLFREAAAMEEIDSVGLNCGIGPAHMKQVFKKLNLGGKYITALPNAGYPMQVRGIIKYDNNPEYFADIVSDLAKEGVHVIGGCCGTTPAFIKALSEKTDTSIISASDMGITENAITDGGKKAGFLYNSDGTIKNKKLIAVELAPPANADDLKIMEAAMALTSSGVDVVTFPDSPSGRTRIDSVLMAAKVRRETGLNVMPHICCRDKNAIAMRSLLMGAHVNDINNLLVITGDPIPSSVRNTTKAVFNFDSVGLMKIIQDMNEEIFTDINMTYGGAINQGRRNLDVEISRVKKKMQAGAEFFLTQPAFTESDVTRIRQIKEKTGARILCGIMPLISRKNALFMKNEIAGIPVTDEVVNRYPLNGTKEEGEQVGIDIAKEMIACTEEFVDGYYFSFPFNKVYLLEKILEH